MLSLITRNEEIIMSLETDALDQAEAAAKANSDADDAAEKLLITLSGMVADLKNSTTDPAVVARITALATAIGTRAGQLSSAVVAGTPAAPAA
jgi:type IV secretory pathway TrbF-like protein